MPLSLRDQGKADGRVVVSGGDHLTCERQIGSQRHLMCGNTRRDRLELLEPVVEDWHALVCLLNVSKVHVNFNYCYHTCLSVLCFEGEAKEIKKFVHALRTIEQC